jgi:integrase/recombinase XerC
MIKVFQEWLLGTGKSAGLVRQTVDQLRYCQIHIDKFPDCTQAEIDTFMSTTLANASPAYRKSMRSALMAFFAYAVKNNFIKVDPTFQNLPFTASRALPRPVSEEAFRVAYDCASPEAKCMILLGGMGGLRLSEITYLHMENRQGNLLRIPGKGAKERTIPMNATLVAALDRLESEIAWGYYFPNRQTCGVRSISDVAMEIEKDLPSRYRAQNLRHRAAATAYKATKDIEAVQKFLGYSASANLYLPMSDEDRKDLSDLTDWQDLF